MTRQEFEARLIQEMRSTGTHWGGQTVKTVADLLWPVVEAAEYAARATLLVNVECQRCRARMKIEVALAALAPSRGGEK